MVARRRKLLVGALTLISCCCPSPTLSFVPSTPQARGGPGVGAEAEKSPARRRSSTAMMDPAAHTRYRLQRRVRVGGGPVHREQQHKVAGSSLRTSTSTSPAGRRSGGDSDCSRSSRSSSGGGMLPLMMAAAAADDGSGAGGEAATDAFIASTSGTTATPVAPPADKSDNDNEEDELPLTLDKAIEEGFNRAMRGDNDVLRQVLAPGVQWEGPLGGNSGLAKVEEELRGLGNLLSEPRLSVFASKDAASKLEWVASGTWRLPWLPRFIVRGSSAVETGSDGKVIRITDTWEGNPLSLALKHLVPGFWDIWHQLGSPPAEKYPYRVLKRTLSYTIREYAPRLVAQPSLTDYSNAREIRKALILPGFCHDGNLKTSGRKPDEYYVTGPVEVAIQPFIATGSFPNGTWFNGTIREASQSRRANRITWTVPVPTAMGLDPTTLPEPPSERERGEDQRSRHVRQGARRIAVASFNGIPQDPEAAEVRAKLIKSLAADGVVPNKGADGRIRSGILMHNSVACFTRGGRLAMSILYHRPKYIGIGNEVFVELDEEEAVTKEVVDGKRGGGTW